jgi:nitrogen PTS system EIIA component
MKTEACFPAGSVITDLQGSDKYEALRDLIHRAPVFQCLDSREALVEAVVARERLQSTGLGHGVAVAHGRVEGAQRILIGLGIHREGVAFDCPDGEPVRLLFVIASPLAVTLDYLQALSTLVRCLRDGEIRACLLEAPGAAEIERRLREAFTGCPAVADR